MLKKAFLLSFNRYCRTINYPDLYNSGAGSGQGVGVFNILFTLTHGPPVVPFWENRKLMAHYLPLRIQFLQARLLCHPLPFLNNIHVVNGRPVNLSGLTVTVDKWRGHVTSVFASSMDQKTRDFKPTQFLKDFTNSRFLRETCSCRLASLIFFSFGSKRWTHSKRNNCRSQRLPRINYQQSIHDRVARSCIVSPRLSSLS